MNSSRGTKQAAGTKRQPLRGIAPVGMDPSRLCKACRPLPLGSGCLRHPCTSCKQGGVPRGLRLCARCSDERGECRRCLRPLTSGEPDSAPADQIAAKSSRKAPARKPAPGKQATCNSCLAVPLPVKTRAGSCANCSGFTSSTAITLCDTCQPELKQCNRCRKPLAAPSGRKSRTR
ncbi:MAG TPA: hypothetical protein V6D08_03760 [Candidatus Obscuribacterales bacterium]